MAGVIYIKGVRTRFQNTLTKEIDRASTVIRDDDEELDLDVRLRNITSCIEKVTLYEEKLKVQSEKFAIALEDDADQIEKVVDEDYHLCSQAVDICFELENLHKKLQHEKVKEESKVVESNTHELVEIQKNMHDILASQLKQQELSLKKDSERMSAVKLPKIDMIAFGGDKTKWIEFYDSFESAVHNNKSISNVEKFNYLKSKLFGEARNAIAGLALSSGNYAVALDILKKIFGNKQEIIDMHYNQLINLNGASNKEHSLRHLLDSVEKHIRSLEVLEQNINQDIVVSIVKSKLPRDVMIQLQIQYGVDKKWTVKSLSEKLREYIVAPERAAKDTSSSSPRRDLHNVSSHEDRRHSGQKQHTPNRLFTAGAMVVNENTGSKKKAKCRYCDNSHYSDQCRKYPTIEDRKKRLEKSCFKCLTRDHFAKNCKSRNRCFYCKKENEHHSSLCPQKFKRNKNSSENTHLSTETDSKEESTEAEPELLSCNEMVLMQTALTEIKHPETNDNEEVRILLDSGSHRSYISEKLACLLHLKEEGEQEIHVVTFGNQKAKTIKTKFTNVDVKLKNGKYMNIKMNIVPVISGKLQRKPVNDINSDKVSDMIASVQLADVVPKEHETSPIEFLIGNDYYLDFVNGEKIEIQEGLYLLSSKLGWLLTGRTNKKNDENHETNILVLTLGSEVNKTTALSAVDSSMPPTTEIEDFWKVEAIGITDKQTNTDDTLAMKQFTESVKSEDNRDHVTWPWKSDNSDLAMNKDLALGRLRSTVTRMKNKPEIMEKYHVIKDQPSNITLTPEHFITLNPKTGIFDNEFDENGPNYDQYESSSKKLLKIWNKGQKLLQKFWNIWLNEFLFSLCEWTQTKLKSHRTQSSFQPNVGDVVIIKNELPRGSWKLEKISQLVVSNDGKCRSAKVLLATGNTIGRPLNNLYPVEVSNNVPTKKSIDPKGEDTSVQEVRARVPRKAAVVARDKTRQLIAEKLVE